MFRTTSQIPTPVHQLFCRFQDRQVVGANLRLQASESPLLVQARRIALGDRAPVVLTNLSSDRYLPGSLASERPVLVVCWGLLSMVVRSLSLSVSCAGVNSWLDLYNDRRRSIDAGTCALAAAPLTGRPPGSKFLGSMTATGVWTRSSRRSLFPSSLKLSSKLSTCLPVHHCTASESDSLAAQRLGVPVTAPCGRRGCSCGRGRCEHSRSLHARFQNDRRDGAGWWCSPGSSTNRGDCTT